MLFPHKPDPPDLALKGGTLHFVFSRWHRRSMSEKRLELVRGLGPSASAAIVVGTMIGTGIFLKPAEMAREGRYVSLVFGAWIVGAVLSVFGALSYAELGSSIPEAGGEYAYLRRGFGTLWGFLFGWMHSIVVGLRRTMSRSYAFPVHGRFPQPLEHLQRKSNSMPSLPWDVYCVERPRTMRRFITRSLVVSGSHSRRQVFLMLSAF